MIVLGIILLILAAVGVAPGLLFPLGAVLLVVGIVLNFVELGGSRRRVF